MSRLTYVVGVPGAGKTTALRAGLDTLPAKWSIESPRPGLKITRHADLDLAVLGTYLGHAYDGTDRLSMGVQPQALDWLAEHPATMILGEGDRLGTNSFFRAAAELGYTVTVIRLDADPLLATQRRARRGGKDMSDSWLKGRETKVARLEVDLTLDASKSTAILGREILRIALGR